jgi:predicted transcriptional regulator
MPIGLPLLRLSPFNRFCTRRQESAASSILAGGDAKMESKNGALEMAASIVAAYVGNNTVPQSDLPRLIADVYRALVAAASGDTAREAPPEVKPAVNVRRSITPEYIVCLEDGKKFKSLKRHLRSRYNMSPEQYREKWGLPADYPMVAPNYAAARASLARNMGLGKRGGK